ncbi:MAG: hypothetical protein AB7F28_05845 [Candidatus Margulisiibacteriota bacterium]
MPDALNDPLLFFAMTTCLDHQQSGEEAFQILSWLRTHFGDRIHDSSYLVALKRANLAQLQAIFAWRGKAPLDKFTVFALSDCLNNQQDGTEAIAIFTWVGANFGLKIFDSHFYTNTIKRANLQQLKVVYQGMCEQKITPDRHFFMALTDCLNNQHDGAEAMLIFRWARATFKNRLEVGHYTVTLKHLSFDQVKKVFAWMDEDGVAPDSFTVKALVDCLNNQTDGKEAMRILEWMRTRFAGDMELIAYNVALKQADLTQIQTIFSWMERAGLRPDTFTWMAIADSLGNQSDRGEAIRILNWCRQHHLSNLEPLHYQRCLLRLDRAQTEELFSYLATDPRDGYVDHLMTVFVPSEGLALLMAWEDRPEILSKFLLRLANHVQSVQELDEIVAYANQLGLSGTGGNSFEVSLGRQLQFSVPRCIQDPLVILEIVKKYYLPGQALNAELKWISTPQQALAWLAYLYEIQYPYLAEMGLHLVMCLGRNVTDKHHFLSTFCVETLGEFFDAYPIPTAELMWLFEQIQRVDRGVLKHLAEAENAMVVEAPLVAEGVAELAPEPVLGEPMQLSVPEKPSKRRAKPVFKASVNPPVGLSCPTAIPVLETGQRLLVLQLIMRPGDWDESLIRENLKRLVRLYNTHIHVVVGFNQAANQGELSSKWMDVRQKSFNRLWHSVVLNHAEEDEAAIAQHPATVSVDMIGYTWQVESGDGIPFGDIRNTLFAHAKDSLSPVHRLAPVTFMSLDSDVKLTKESVESLGFFVQQNEVGVLSFGYRLKTGHNNLIYRLDSRLRREMVVDGVPFLYQTEATLCYRFEDVGQVGADVFGHKPGSEYLELVRNTQLPVQPTHLTYSQVPKLMGEDQRFLEQDEGNVLSLFNSPQVQANRRNFIQALMAQFHIPHGIAEAVTKPVDVAAYLRKGASIKVACAWSQQLSELLKAGRAQDFKNRVSTVYREKFTHYEKSIDQFFGNRKNQACAEAIYAWAALIRTFILKHQRAFYPITSDVMPPPAQLAEASFGREKRFKKVSMKECLRSLDEATGLLLSQYARQEKRSEDDTLLAICKRLRIALDSPELPQRIKAYLEEMAEDRLTAARPKRSVTREAAFHRAAAAFGDIRAKRALAWLNRA